MNGKIVVILIFILSSFNMLAQNDMLTNKIEHCFSLLDSAKILVLQNREDSLIVDYYFKASQCYLDHNDVLKGLNCLMKAEELAEENHRFMPNIYIGIGVIYDHFEVFDKTLEYGLKANGLAKKCKDVEGELVSIFTITSAAFQLQKYDLLKEVSQRAIELRKTYNLDSSFGYIYFLLGKTALEEREIDLAIEYFQEGLKISKEKNQKDEIASAHEGLSMAMLEKNELVQAKFHADQALLFIPNYISDRNIPLSNVYAKNGEHKKAFDLLYENILEKEAEKKVNPPNAIITEVLNEKFEQEKSREQEEFNAELNFQKKLGIRNLLFGFAILIIAFLTFLYLNNRKRNQELEQHVKEKTKEILSQKEQLQELDLAKSRLYTNITHEFRTPLTVISGIAEQIENDDDRKGLIKRNSDQLLNLVNQMLDLRKIESGSIVIQKTQGDIIKFFRYLTESLKSYAEMKGLTLHFLSEEKSLMMDFDVEKITRIHSNLLSNAIKFTPEGGDVYVQIQTDEKKEDQQFICKVWDTGMGIPADKLTNIFERFYQVDDSTTRKGEGTGIGLTLVSELIKAMKGQIKVKSTEGQGTSFTITLPITNVAEMGQENTSDNLSNLKMIVTDASTSFDQKVEEQDSSKPVALIIEDNADVIHYLISCLKEKYSIEIAMNGEEGIAKAIENIPDFIVSDVMMPIKDGFEVCQTLKTDERTSHIPIILLTAKADIESRLEGLQRGADAYLSKPFLKEELLIILKNQLDLRKLLQGKFRQFSKESLSEIETTFADKEAVQQHLKIEDVFLQKIRNIIEKDLSDNDIGMPQLMRGLGMSRSQIYKKVKALTGHSPSIYIRSIRLYHAQQLLKTSDLNVSEVAYEVGFTSPAYFSNVFFEEFGYRPNKTSK